MKRLCLLILPILVFSSCENTWSSENKELFHQACVKERMDNNITEAKAKEICDCRIEKIIEKHPKFAEAMENIIEVVNDPDVKACDN